eukprot:CAMPEP_0176025590 /NCGR_PEP_ID=MMETSP0120_2-20121206/12521_1 /TAXON_ID=160619 /ORGANISM="Kryptoperidinium foliaceum, Strain CCMP 1326" /LENGTH=80 /DNA_ID=CAMNT_0017358775 /DNA_START=63 /DNA_END=305 /DNA_ORIENTATION=+
MARVTLAMRRALVGAMLLLWATAAADEPAAHVAADAPSVGEGQADDSEHGFEGEERVDGGEEGWFADLPDGPIHLERSEL